MKTLTQYSLQDEHGHALLEVVGAGGLGRDGDVRGAAAGVHALLAADVLGLVAGA